MADIKYYLHNRIVFYENQILNQYVYDKGSVRYQQKVLLKKFLIHYCNNKPYLYFKLGFFDKKYTYTLPVTHLGKFYFPAGN